MQQYFSHATEKYSKYSIIMSVCRCCLKVVGYAPKDDNLEAAELAHFKRCDEIARQEMGVELDCSARIRGLQ